MAILFGIHLPLNGPTRRPPVTVAEEIILEEAKGDLSFSKLFKLARQLGCSLARCKEIAELWADDIA
jgi:hypothetical protein